MAFALRWDNVFPGTLSKINYFAYQGEIYGKH